ncbi:hypothetical protein [Plasmodium yoelii yoelii]|uniref:Uncharacterized protein n=1 Tax=Plasmodium yoelii yoelii TaxID=73239 RepID=Q7RB51_PLAYO|nr:hypothetical protein [Plasmodium yoelii yoelii]
MVAKTKTTKITLKKKSVKNAGKLVKSKAVKIKGKNMKTKAVVSKSKKLNPKKLNPKKLINKKAKSIKSIKSKIIYYINRANTQNKQSIYLSFDYILFFNIYKNKINK